ncbi:MAG TPA: oligopeptidase A, partial [Burkholderiales bacterium]
MNPLLDFSGLPRFASIRPAHVTAAVDTLLRDNRALIERLTQTDTPATWRAFVEPLEDAHERLSRAWGVVGHLHSVLDSPELREVYNANQPKIVEYYTELGQNLTLFDKYKALKSSPEYANLDAAQRTIIDNEIRDFRLSGAELSDEKKKRFGEISAALAQLSTKFSENVLD